MRGALSGEDLALAAVPRVGEQFQIGWIPLYPGMPGWLTVDHIDHFPPRPWKDEEDADLRMPAAICVVHVESADRDLSP